MLANENRLKKRKEFGYIYKNGDSQYSKNLVVMHTVNKFKKVRIGFSISKKVGKAFIRNRIKRQMRAIIRENIANIPPAKNYVVIAKPSIVDLSYEEMKRELLGILARIGKGAQNVG